MIDLHSHTSASDGQFAPKEQVAKAAKAGISVLAITDHDTVAGIDEGTTEAQRQGVRLVPGIEISCQLHRREVHLLGHFIDAQHRALTSYIDRLRGERHQRMRHIVEKLVGMGIPISMALVEDRAGSAPLTRPHVAGVLVDLRICTSIKEAFSRFLGDRRLAWLPRQGITIEEGISLIRDAGGTATLAHPGSSKINRLELEMLVKAGLVGLEVIHQDHPPSQREVFERWAADFNLVGTAGSDFHGEKVAPDRTFGSVSMSHTALERLEGRRP